jgi:hypothetical protein
LSDLAKSYQTEKKAIVRDDFASVVIEALHNLHNLHHLHNLYGEVCNFEVTTKEVVKQVITFAEPTEGETEDPETAEKSTRSLSTKVGIALRQLRFSRKGQVKRGEPVRWRVSWDVLTKCIFSHGLLHLFPDEGCEGYAGQKPLGSSENSPSNALPQNSVAQPLDPQDVGYESYVGYEVMRDNKNSDLQKNSPLNCVCGEPLPENRKVCFTCGRPRGTIAETN